jgi:hypothetical protein
MDARKDRIGEHAAEHTPPRAAGALGPVPQDAVDRVDWQHRASSIGAWRELSGHRDPADPIGPEPVAAAPDLRAAWHEALAALAPPTGPTCAACPTADQWIKDLAAAHRTFAENGLAECRMTSPGRSPSSRTSRRIGSGRAALFVSLFTVRA